MNSTLALISGLGLGLGLETSGLGLEALGLGLETPGLVNIPDYNYTLTNTRQISQVHREDNLCDVI